MNIASTPQASLADRMKAHTGRFVDKTFDWNAFPSNAGFDDLARAQMRYIGAGGSPKVGDPTTLKADNFTLSLIYKEPGRYAACHSHEIEESFLILSGALVVGWEKHGEVVEVNLGPRDMILNAREIGHGFRVDGVEPVIMSISVDVGKPLPPVYHYHPKEHPAELARTFGAEPGKTMPFDRNGTHEIQKLMADYVVRYTELPTIWEDAGFTRKVYVGDAPGAVKHDSTRKEMWGLPMGAKNWRPSRARSRMRISAWRAASRSSGSARGRRGNQRRAWPPRSAQDARGTVPLSAQPRRRAGDGLDRDRHLGR